LDHYENSEEFVDLVDPSSDQDTRPGWIRETLKDVEVNKTPRCWLWINLIIFLIQSFFSTVLGPHSLTRLWGGFFLHNCR
jgi:hypothetical protein